MILGSGCFDGLHGGHARYLSALKKLAQPGEEVVIAVAPDAYIDTVKKRQPRWPQRERFRAVVECGVKAVAQESDTVAAVVQELKPRIFAKGLDWCGQLPADVIAACQDVGSLVVYVDTPGTHTREAIG